MNHIIKILTIVLIVMASVEASAKAPKPIAYKIDSMQCDEAYYYRPLEDLVVYRYKAKNNKAKDKPAIVFFHGGGWIKSAVTQFKPHAIALSDRGVDVFIAFYRTMNTHKASPFEALKDAKSVMRFVRSNAKYFRIDPNRIVGGGGSAGGHLAAATALIEKYNHPSDDMSVSSKANALVLFNPVINNGPGREGAAHERIGDRYVDFSPAHNIKAGAPPTIMFFGTNDSVTPVFVADAFKAKMEAVGSRCDVIYYEGQKHSFFNYPGYLEKTLAKADEFLVSIGYLKPLDK